MKSTTHSRRLLAGIVLVGCLGGVGIIALALTKNGTEPPLEAAMIEETTPSNATLSVPRDEARVRSVPASNTQPVQQEESGAKQEISPLEDALNVDTLRSALEDGLFGRINPKVFVDAALALAELDVGKEISGGNGPSPSVATRYEIVGTPQGIRAELWMRKVPASVDYSAMSYALYCDLPCDPYIVEGAVRSNLMTEMMLCIAPDGGEKSLTILTDMDISGRTKRLGLPLDGIPRGLLYFFDVNKPFDMVGHVDGIVKGNPTVMEGSSLTLTGAPLTHKDLQLLHSGFKKTVAAIEE